MYPFKQSSILRIAHVSAITGLLVASNSFFITNYPVLIYVVMTLLGVYSLLNLKSGLSDIIIAASIFTVYILAASAQMLFYEKINLYFGGVIFLVVIFYFKYQRDPTVIKSGLDTFFWIILVFFVLEVLIKTGVPFPGSEELIEKFSQMPTSRIDVFRITALYGTPLILGPVIVFYLLREILLYRRPLYLAVGLFVLLATGSRSALLIGILICMASFIAIRSKASYRLLGKGLILSLVLFSVIYALPGSDGFERTIDRAFNIFSLDIFGDQSIHGRGDTSWAAFQEVLKSPATIAFGVENTKISDSAISSIAQQNGLLFTILFYSFVFFYIFQSMPYFYAWITFFTVLLLSLSVGGALSFSPLIILTAVIFEINNRRMLKIDSITVPLALNK